MFLGQNRSISSAALIRRVRGRPQSGFTLVEMLVVLAIIGLIVGLVGPRVIGYLGESKIKAAQIEMENISTALELFYLDAGRYPTTAEGLLPLVQRPGDAKSWHGPYLKSESLPKDPWGHNFIYRSPGEKTPFDLGSMGPDGSDVNQIVLRRFNASAK